ncbi:MAG: hypothetical protein ACLFS9_02335 [Nitriliruptoraceae bacterium]
MRWDDRMWEELWERTLGQPERHRLAMATLRREFPDDPLGRRVVPELARRWRSTARLHLWLHTVLGLFWLRVSFDIPTVSGTPWRLANALALTSLAIALGCSALRRYLHPLERLV